MKEAEQAIAVELDPQKKRALQSQLKELAKELKPKIQALDAEFIKLGGMNKLRTLQTAAEEIIEKLK